MLLPKTTEKLLAEVESLARNARSEELDKFLEEAADMRKRLGEPLRVAVVGVMKAGKSTLINAMLGKKILFTDTLEATCIVTHFKYAETPSLEIRFKDGTTKPAPFEELQRWTARPADAEKHSLDDVERVYIRYDSPVLKKFEIIDTPGFGSTQANIAAHVRSFMGQKLDEESDRVTAERAAEAEAIIYAFSRSLSGGDSEVLDAFKGDTSASSPINSIGLFTMADIYWRHHNAPPETSPLDTVRETSDQYAADLRDKLYAVYPVTAKVAETVSEMDDDTYAILKSLADVDPEIFWDYYLSDAKAFREEEGEEMPVPASERAHVLSLFGQYGVFLLVSAIRDGADKGSLPERVLEASGVKTAAARVISHFGNRAFLIKLEFVLRRLRTVAGEIKRGGSERAAGVCEHIIERIDEMRREDSAFSELDVLNDYYKGKLRLPDDSYREQLLQITGESGSGAARRLGLPDATELTRLREEALGRVQKWSKLENNFAMPPAVKKSASVIRRSCESMHYYLSILSGYDE
jgi:GTPase SAR1 family protein